jgi:hypothetical protein
MIIFLKKIYEIARLYIYIYIYLSNILLKKNKKHNVNWIFIIFTSIAATQQRIRIYICYVTTICLLRLYTLPYITHISYIYNEDMYIREIYPHELQKKIYKIDINLLFIQI